MRSVAVACACFPSHMRWRCGGNADSQTSTRRHCSEAWGDRSMSINENQLKLHSSCFFFSIWRKSGLLIFQLCGLCCVLDGYNLHIHVNMKLKREAMGQCALWWHQHLVDPSGDPPAIPHRQGSSSVPLPGWDGAEMAILWLKDGEMLSCEVLLGQYWLSIGTGCPKRLWSLPPWRYQKLSGHGPGQPALGRGGPAWAEGLDQVASRGSFQPQPLCDSAST